MGVVNLHQDEAMKNGRWLGEERTYTNVDMWWVIKVPKQIVDLSSALGSDTLLKLNAKRDMQGEQ